MSFLRRIFAAPPSHRDALDIPALCGLSLRELADLPFPRIVPSALSGLEQAASARDAALQGGAVNDPRHRDGSV